MIRLSPGVLASAHKLFKRILVKEDYDLESLLSRNVSIDGTSAKDVIDTSRACGWIIFEQNRNCLSDKGKIYASEFDIKTRRLMISDYIKNATDAWIFLIPRGRKECISYIPSDVLVCLRSAKLLESPPSDDIVLWWDSQAQLIGNIKDDKALSVGRAGEKLTLKYESERTDAEPIWKAIESNLVGYDVLSIIEKNETVKLLIEVKASTRKINNAEAFITRNEWDTAINSNNYVFHFWLISEKSNELAVLSIDDIRSHIPEDQGRGEWKEAKVAFNLFEDRFGIVL